MDYAIVTSLITLTFMEIVLGIDNIIFLSILVERVDVSKQNVTRNLGLALALVMRLGLLLSISWVMGLTKPWINLFSLSFSGRDLILLFGGIFLIAKSTLEIHHKVEGQEKELDNDSKIEKSRMTSVLLQIVILDLVFSLDSVITAVGMANIVWVMVLAMVLSMLVMVFTAKSIGEFVTNHPSIKILALSFLLLIGVMLTVEGMGQHINKGYIYFAIFFSLAVEMLNMRYRRKMK